MGLEWGRNPEKWASSGAESWASNGAELKIVGTGNARTAGPTGNGRKFFLMLCDYIFYELNSLSFWHGVPK